eukprot:1409729-Amphidinium_carterae.1
MPENSFLREREVAKHSVLKERVIPKPVVGKRGRSQRKLRCTQFCCGTFFPLSVPTTLRRWTREVNIDEEDFFCKVGRRTIFHGGQ